MASTHFVADITDVSIFYLRQKLEVLTIIARRRLADPMIELQAIRSFCITVELMASVKCYGSILDVRIPAYRQ